MSKTPTKEVNIRTLYAELNKFGQAEEYEKAIKVANKSKRTKHLTFYYFNN